MNIGDYRRPEYPVHEQFIERWSPRAISPEGFTEEQLMALFEAAKWAPSSSNEQPWLFFYAMHGSAEWPSFFELLVEGNRSWAKNAGALVVVCSRKTFARNGKFSRTHSYDTGCAWGYLALQAYHQNLVAHGMAGFNYDQARITLNLPEDIEVEAMAAVG